jgi:secreted PhoX family phosphatase
MADPITPEGAAEGTTRRHFIRGVATAGASTVAASALLADPGIADLLGDSEAKAAQGVAPFGDFRAVAASSADAFEVPDGYRAHVVIGYGDAFENTDGTRLTFGYNNDFLAFFPLEGKKDEGLLFVNHEYPAPFFQHGNKDGATKTAAQIAIEQESVGNAIVHVRKDGEGLWQVVSPSPYNRRITGTDPVCEFTGPLAGTTRVGDTARGSLANCSGGITPWGTALSCEENYQDYAVTYGWANANGLAADPTNAEYDHVALSKYGWVVETDPYDPSWTPLKHTALGRFRHENTAFRADPGKKFVLYMGDDVVNGGVYKFVSDHPFIPGRRSHNLRILSEGKLYIAWFDESRRKFAALGDTDAITPDSGWGYWREVDVNHLEDTNVRIRQAVGDAEWANHYATNRPEDLEVDTDGTVYIAFTNNTGTGVFDAHGAIRKLVEAGNDPTAVGPSARFAWSDYAGGGDKGADKPAGERGFSSCDNLCFDSHGNLWVVTDISSSSLSGSRSRAPYYEYHLNNAVFMIPRSGPNAGVAFRFANMPAESEGTGPYFTPDEDTLFLNVQHPGEETAQRGVYGDFSTYTSYWPKGNKTTGQNPSTPVPSLVAVTKLPPREVPRDDRPPVNQIPPPPVDPGRRDPPASDRAKPRLRAIEVPRRRAQRQLLRGGLPVELRVDEAARAVLVLTARVPTLVGRGRRARRKLKVVTLGRATRSLRAGEHKLVVKLSAAGKLRIRALRGRDVTATVTIQATDAAGNRSAAKRNVKLV